LGRHDFSVGAGDLDPRVQAGLDVGLDNVTAEDLAGADTTVVRALGAREAAHRPAVGPTVHVEEGILLLEAEPRLLLLVVRGELIAFVAVVVGVRRAVGIPALTDHQDVRGQTEGVWEDRHRAQVDVRVVARGLPGRRAIKVPFGKVLDGELAALWNLGESLGEVSKRSRGSALRMMGTNLRFRAEATNGIDPDVPGELSGFTEE
jgi:hypothetical protein